MSQKWLLLTYRIPREPTAGRVFVWRKLKRLGAVAIQDAVWVLPSTSRTREQFQWLVSEIKELEGEAVLWEGDQIDATDPESLQRQFSEPVDAECRGILAALKKKNRDLAALSQRFRDVAARDFFGSELCRRVREELLAAAGK